jgi:hypothetical protein
MVARPLRPPALTTVTDTILPVTVGVDTTTGGAEAERALPPLSVTVSVAVNVPGV